MQLRLARRECVTEENEETTRALFILRPPLGGEENLSTETSLELFSCQIICQTPRTPCEHRLQEKRLEWKLMKQMSFAQETDTRTGSTNYSTSLYKNSRTTELVWLDTSNWIRPLQDEEQQRLLSLR